MKKYVVIGVIAFIIVSFTGCQEEHKENNDNIDSEDPGGSGWIDEGIVIDNGYYWNPEIVQLEDETYRMYVEDHGSSSTTLLGIVSLTSSDGVDWEYEQMILEGASHPGIVHLDDGRWRLYFQSQYGIESAISEDGVSFTDELGIRLLHDPDVEGANIRHPCIVSLPEGGFRMYYDTDAEGGSFIRIWSAYSSDGINFTREGLNIDLTPWRNDWPEGWYAHASKPEVLQTPDGLWRMFFASSRLVGSVYRPMTIRMATSFDGVTWDIKIVNYEITGVTMDDGKSYSPFDVSVKIMDNESTVRMYYSLFLSPEEGFVGDYSGIYTVSKPLYELE